MYQNIKSINISTTRKKNNVTAFLKIHHRVFLIHTVIIIIITHRVLYIFERLLKCLLNLLLKAIESNDKRGILNSSENRLVTWAQTNEKIKQFILTIYCLDIVLKNSENKNLLDNGKMGGKERGAECNLRPIKNNSF